VPSPVLEDDPEGGAFAGFGGFDKDLATVVFLDDPFHQGKPQPQPRCLVVKPGLKTVL